MNALILRGKFKGNVADVSQWCNDWFTLNSDNDDIMRKVWSPTSLGFSFEGMREIRDHQNSGMLFAWYQWAAMKKFVRTEEDFFIYTFKKRNGKTKATDR